MASGAGAPGGIGWIGYPGEDGTGNGAPVAGTAMVAPGVTRPPAEVAP
jgi:hypothetical protein